MVDRVFAEDPGETSSVGHGTAKIVIFDQRPRKYEMTLWNPSISPFNHFPVTPVNPFPLATALALR